MTDDKKWVTIDMHRISGRNTMTLSAYIELLREDLIWLNSMPDTLENRHIRCILEGHIAGLENSHI